MNTETDIDFIKRCAKEHKVFWSYHSNMRLGNRAITREMVFGSISKCDIIENYPNDYPLPSCLCLGYFETEALHYVIALDREGDNIRMVTIYRPDPLRWEDGFIIRRKP